MGSFHDASEQAMAFLHVTTTSMQVALVADVLLTIQVQNWAPQMAALSHSLTAGATANEVADSYQKHVENNGKPESHAYVVSTSRACSLISYISVQECKGYCFRVCLHNY
jgi:Protein of unknown function (DUF3759)